MKTTTLQRLRSLSAIAFCVLLLPPGANAQIPTLQRYVDCSAPASLAIETVRGETLYLDFLYRQTNADFSVEASSAE